jgi:sec-independent protein translocase protein TatB
MFDIGFAEMIIIGIVALLVIGPERLPGVARQAGIYFGRIKRFVSSVRSDVEREFRTEELQRMLDEQKTELQSLKQAVDKVRDDADLKDVEQAINETAQNVLQDNPPDSAKKPAEASGSDK